MFFMIGATNGRKDFDFSQSILCSVCGRYGSYRVYMTYMSLLIFFIPCLKWDKRYYVETSCCGRLYELDPEVGKRISRGESVQINEYDLRPVNKDAYYRSPVKRCAHCGYETDEDFQYCPKCGREL